MAQTLASRRHEVHVLCVSSKAALMVAAVQCAPMAPNLTSLSHSTASSGPQQPIVQWQHSATGSSACAITFHAVLSDAGDAEAADTEAVHAMLAGLARQLMALHPDQPTGPPQNEQLNSAWLIVDADDCQVQPSRQHNSDARGDTLQVGTAPAGTTDAAASCQQVVCSACSRTRTAPAQRAVQSSKSLFEQLVAAAPVRRVVALVQNVHFLPCGPSGTSQRTPGLLQAWHRLGGVVCVSEFVRGYLQQHLARALSISGDEVQQSHGALSMPPLHVTRLSAWGCFGQGPFHDCSQNVAAQAQHWRPPSANVPSLQQQQQHEGGTRQQLPVIGCLKLTPEKGCSIVHQLARALEGRCRFLLVSGDPAVDQFFSGMKHVKVVPPQPDVEELLKRLCLVLAPSLWLEAWGMVVVDAMLRAVPVLTSDAGALPEAGLGQCTSVHVEPIHVPTCCQCGTPTWAGRQYKPQPLQPWVDAVDALLRDPQALLERAQACRKTAAHFVLALQDTELQTFFAWLQSLNVAADDGW